MNIRLKLVFVMIVIVLLSLGMMKSVPATTIGEPLIIAMESTGAQVEEFSINAWVKLSKSHFNDEELANILEEVMGELGVNPASYQLTRNQNKKQRSIQAEVINQSFHAIVTAKNIPSEINIAETEWYLVVNIEDKASDNLSIRKIEGKIRSIIQKFGSSPHISTCLIGWLNGTLRDGEQHSLVENAFRIIDAKIINKLEAEQFISYTGFSSGILEWLNVGRDKVNFNMAMRYSKYDNRTYVTIGSPIITREY